MADIVMIVEDESVIRSGMEQLLHCAGYAPVSAPNGQDALELLRAGVPVKVILLDLMMPVMNGWTFREEQLRDPKLAHIPVIVLSALQHSGIDDPAPMLSKPINFQQLLAQITEALTPAPADAR
jgi:CheY-like chemotaxis protein